MAKKVIQNIRLSDFCNMYIALKVTNSKNLPPHDRIVNFDVSKTTDPIRQNLLKKFINWYAGIEIHRIN
jgi:hypothetical protein